MTRLSFWEIVMILILSMTYYHIHIQIDNVFGKIVRMFLWSKGNYHSSIAIDEQIVISPEFKRFVKKKHYVCLIIKLGRCVIIFRKIVEVIVLSIT